MTPRCYLFSTQTCFSAFSLPIIYLSTVHWVKTRPDVWINKKMLSLSPRNQWKIIKNLLKMHDLHFKDKNLMNKASSRVIEWIISFILSIAGSLVLVALTLCVTAIEFQIRSMRAVFQTPLPSSYLPAHTQAPSSWDAVQHLADRFLRTLTGCRQLLVLEKGVSLLVRSSGTCSICAREMWGE